MHLKKQNNFLWYLNKNKTIKATIASIGLKMHLVLQPNDHFMVVWLDQPKDQNQQLISSLTFIASQGSKNRKNKTKPATQTSGRCQCHRKTNWGSRSRRRVNFEKQKKGWNSPKAFYLQKRCDQVLAGDLRSCLGTAVPVSWHSAVTFLKFK